ncbi:MAG: hypothetical protein Q8S41_02730 [Lutibacter sp.]|nr:hypothetical protein [Lutibacter sp.]
MRILNLKLLVLFIVGNFIFTSCSNSDTVDLSESISADETIALVEVDDISDEVNNVIDDYFAADEQLLSKSEEENKTDVLLTCVTKTIVVTGTLKVVTLDFGDGCELPSGNVLSGKIIMSYSIDPNLLTLTITYMYENFYFNDIRVEGENIIVRIRENENGNPQSTLTYNTTLIWSDGVYASKKGTIVREWAEGYDTRIFGDNVFLITGNWTVTFSDGTIFFSNIIEPLRREMACRYIVSGVVELQKLDIKGMLDFGDGTCDDKAILTNEAGEASEITLTGRMY